MLLQYLLDLSNKLACYTQAVIEFGKDQSNSIV